MNEIQKEVEEQLTLRTLRNFKITNVPLPVLVSFKEYCAKECGDVYAVGLQQLLKTKEMYENLIPLLSSVLSEVDNLKDKINNQTQSTKKEVKTFG